jgi:general secretion pathway protein K
MAGLVSIWKSVASTRGSALVAVIFALLVVAAITGTLITQTRTDLLLSQTLGRQVENELAAEGGIAVAIFLLSDPKNDTPFIADSRASHIVVDSKDLTLQVQSEAGKINLNQSPNPLLGRLLHACANATQADMLGDAIEGRVTAKDGPAKAFLTVDELKRLPGAGTDLVEAIEPYVSVYNFAAEPDFALAPARLKALIAGAGSRASSDASAPPAAENQARTGIFTITASVRDGEGGASIRTTLYLTGEKGEPYDVFDWRRVNGREHRGICGQAEEP